MTTKDWAILTFGVSLPLVLLVGLLGLVYFDPPAKAAEKLFQVYRSGDFCVYVSGYGASPYIAVVDGSLRKCE